MKKFYNLLNKIKIHPLTTCSVALALISGRFKPLFLHLFAATIHELGHILMAMILKVKVNKVEVLPFGLFAEMDNLETKPIYQELLILFSGSLMFFVNLFLFKLMYNHNLISQLAYTQALNSNLIILWFNLLPIYPLDGGKIIGSILTIFLSIKKVYKILFITSFISTLVLIVYTINSPQYLLWSFLIFTQIEFLIKIHLRWTSFLLSRMDKKQSRLDKIHSKLDIYRPYNNYIFFQNVLYNENDVIPLLISRKNNLYKK